MRNVTSFNIVSAKNMERENGNNDNWGKMKVVDWVPMEKPRGRNGKIRTCTSCGMINFMSTLFASVVAMNNSCIFEFSGCCICHLSFPK